MTIDEYFRAFQAQQQEIHRKSLEALAQMSQNNADLIAQNGLLKIASERMWESLLAQKALGRAGDVATDSAGDGGTAQPSQ